MAGLWRRAVALAFHLLYHQLAWTYDAVSWFVSRGRWRAWTAAALPYLPGPRVLELGHGPGHMLAALDGRGDAPVGLDLSPQMGRLAARRWPGAMPPPLVRARAQTPPFAAGAFDGLLVTFPTTYIVEPVTVAAAYRLLRPGGRLVIVPEAQLLGRDPLTRLTEWLYEVTGQRRPAAIDTMDPLTRWANRLTGPGFVVTVNSIAVAGSSVTVVVAERPPNP